VYIGNRQPRTRQLTSCLTIPSNRKRQHTDFTYPTCSPYHWIKTKNKKNGRQYNPLQGTTTFHNTSFKNSTDRYTTKLTTHAIEIRKDNKRTWVAFTHHSPQIRKVTNLFRNTKIGIAFKVQQLTRFTTKNLKSD